VGFLLHFVYVFAHAGGLFSIRVCLLSRAFRARRAAAHSPKLCPAHAFAIWPAIARAPLRTARGMGGSLSGYKHQKRDCGGAHAGLSSLGARNSGCLGDFRRRPVGNVNGWAVKVTNKTKYLASILLAGVLAVPAFAFDIRPDPDSTEGSLRVDGHDRALACDRSNKHRGPMTADRRDEVLIRYGLSPGPHPDYEIDHLIPLCLGGSDDFSNLWPQPRQTIEPKWNAEAKDRLERLICDMVCNGQLDIATAHEAFAKDWIAAYRKYYRGD
jgi:hypothetical protein